MPGQVREVGLLQVWKDDEVIAVIVWGPRGYTKLCDSTPEALGFLAGEFRELGSENLALVALEFFRVTMKAGFCPPEAAKVPGAIIAVRDEGKPIEYLGFDEEKMLVARGYGLVEVSDVLIGRAQDQPSGLRR